MKVVFSVLGSSVTHGFVLAAVVYKSPVNELMNIGTKNIGTKSLNQVK